MLSAEDIAAVKVAVETCNNPELKREVLCVPESEYDSHKTSYEQTHKKTWDAIIERKSAIILKNLGLPARLHGKVTGFVHLVGVRMLNWAEYHEMTLGFSRDYSMSFLSCHFFTSKGIVDNKKAAEELRNDKNLTIKQKYKLACLYFTDNISDLYRQMENEDKEEFYDAQNPARIKQPRWVKFWSYYLRNDIDKLRENRNLSLYMLETAVESGSKVAVEYCLEKTNLSRKKDIVIDAAVEAVRNWSRSVTTDLWVSFEANRYESKETWVPSDYYVNILFFLLAKMRDDQKIVFLKKYFDDVTRGRILYFYESTSKVLECFLKWPYQDYFMNTVKLIWEFLPEMDYAVLLLRMCDMIETECGTLEYGEDRSYNYRGLLKEFWRQSPERCMRYIFSEKVKYSIMTSESKFESVTLEAAGCVKLLFKLLTLRKFTSEDEENINLILASADDKERENIKCSEKWRYICCDLIKKEKWESLDQFVLNWFSTEEEVYKFKKKLSMNYCFCIEFVKKNRWSTAESYLRWLALSETEINKLKKEMIYSPYGRHVCCELISDTRGVKAANEFCEWFLLSEEEFVKFKKLHIFSSMGADYCSRLAREDDIEVADKFIKWCFSSEEDIKEMKRAVAYRNGDFVCEKLISDYSKDGFFHEKGKFTFKNAIKFKGGKWEQVEKFLTWCFSSEKEIGDFKKIVLIGKKSLRIHLNLITCNRWEEAETYFAWLGLSDMEIKKLKKDALFSDYGTRTMFRQLIHDHNRDNYKYIDYGGKQEAIELLLRWHLTDKETVLKFKDEFKRQELYSATEKQRDNFDLTIEQLLNDLDEEKKGIKRKSESRFTCKRICNVELEKMD